MNQLIAPQPATPASRIAFAGRRSDFRRLVMRGTMLELVTVGFYRFWLATDMRRHLWSSTSVEGDAPEYTGTAKELLIGFLFALAILLPIYLIYFSSVSKRSGCGHSRAFLWFSSSTSSPNSPSTAPAAIG